MPKKQRWFWLAALVAAWCFDFLFWNKSANLSFFIWVVVLLAAGYLLAWREADRHPRRDARDARQDRHRGRVLLGVARGVGRAVDDVGVAGRVGVRRTAFHQAS